MDSPLTSLRHDGLTFDVRDVGASDGTPVVALHGFPQGAGAWDDVSHQLSAQGCRVLAPDQRGYSPGARPGAAGDYRMRALVDDVVALLDAAGLESAHLVGHDWGGAVAWAAAAAHPDRLRTLTVLSTPHPLAMAKAMWRGQLARSWYFALFQVPGLAERLLAPGGPVWGALTQGLPAQARERYGRLMSDPEALHGALAWYRAMPADLRSPSVPTRRTRVPTLYIWGTRDEAFGRAAAIGTADAVLGPYRFVALPGAGHWLPERHAEQVSTLLLQHVERSP